MTSVTCQISISLDGYVAGPNQSLQNPIGEDGLRLHQWVFGTDSWRRQHGLGPGEPGLDSDVVQDVTANIGAYLMGRHMFVVPVLLGAGERLLENVGDPVLEPVEVIASAAVTHIRYRVIRN